MYKFILRMGYEYDCMLGAREIILTCPVLKEKLKLKDRTYCWLVLITPISSNFMLDTTSDIVVIFVYLYLIISYLYFLTKGLCTYLPDIPITLDWNCI